MAVYLQELADGFVAERVIAAWIGGRTPAEVYGEERAA